MRQILSKETIDAMREGSDLGLIRSHEVLREQRDRLTEALKVYAKMFEVDIQLGGEGSTAVCVKENGDLARTVLAELGLESE
jgi:hypothetical protein